MTKIIVELCQNHTGSREILEQQIEAAATNGADIVKMQSIWSADVTNRPRFEEGETNPDGSQKTIKRPFAPEVERLAALDLSLDDHRFFIETCEKHGVIPMTTIFARHRIPEVGALPWPGKWIKVASYDCASFPMLRELAAHFDNFIISTGAMYDEEIQKAAELMRSLGKNFIFLHCVTSYPNTVEMANLSRMEWLRQFSPSVGWSDHSLVARDGISIAKVAIALGADYIERHFTVLPATETKDGPVSITPQLLKELSDFRKLSLDEQKAVIEKDIPNWKEMIGSPNRKMTPTELLNRDYYRGRFASPDGNEWIYNWEEKTSRMKILVLVENMTPAALQALSDAGHEVEARVLSQDELNTFTGDHEALVIRIGLSITEGILANFPRLRAIATATTGLNHIDRDATASRRIEVLSLKGERAFLDTITSTAELAFGLLMDIARKTPWAFDSIRRGEYELEKFKGHSLRGKTLGIIGMGRLGNIVARAALGMQMRVVFTDPNVAIGPETSESVSLDVLLQTSDAISLHVHLSPETRGMIGKERIAEMKRGVFLINTSRGELVDESAILAALESGALGGYATDVLTDEAALIEKGTTDNPLVRYAREHDNCLIVPHTGGLTFESREATDRFIADKLIEFAKAI